MSILKSPFKVIKVGMLSNKYMLKTIGLLLIYSLFYKLIHPSLLGIRFPNIFRFWVPLELIHKYKFINILLYLKDSKSLG